MIWDVIWRPKLWKIVPKSRKSEVRGVPEALGRGPGAILAPKGAPGTESMQTGHSSTPPRTHLESQICTFPIFWVFISHLFLDWRLGRLPGRFFMASGRFFHGFADRFFPCFGSAPTGGKCRLDTLLIRFEAQRRCGPEAINMIKSYTFLGCFPEGLLEWILGRFWMDFGIISGAKWTYKPEKWPSEHHSKKGPKIKDARETRGNPVASETGGWGPLKSTKSRSPGSSRAPMDPLSLHFVPWGHGGGYI